MTCHVMRGSQNWKSREGAGAAPWGVLGLMVVVHNFSYGLLTPVLGYVMSCLGCFLGLRCTSRARALHGASRVRWLLLAAVSIGAAGVWGMHFVAMLGFSIPGQSIGYSVPVTILSMLIAAVVVSIGLLIVGFGGDGQGPPRSGRRCGCTRCGRLSSHP